MGGDWVTNGAVGVEQDDYRGTGGGRHPVTSRDAHGGSASGGGELSRLSIPLAASTSMHPISAGHRREPKPRSVELRRSEAARRDKRQLTADNSTCKIDDVIAVTIAFAARNGRPNLRWRRGPQTRHRLCQRQDRHARIHLHVAAGNHRPIWIASLRRHWHNGGTITDALGSNATLTLPSPA